jgi:hypothetical protein
MLDPFFANTHYSQDISRNARRVCGSGSHRARILAGSATAPAFCGAIVGKSAYFSVFHQNLAGCTIGQPTGPYVSVECHPLNTAVSGLLGEVGPFAARVERDPEKDGSVFLTVYLTDRDTAGEVYARSSLDRQIESSIGTASGSC